MHDKTAGRMVRGLAAKASGVARNPAVQNEKGVRFAVPDRKPQELGIRHLLNDEASSVGFIQRLADRVRATLIGLQNRLDEAQQYAHAAQAANISLERRVEDAEAEAKAVRSQLSHLEREFLLLRLKAQEAEIRALMAESRAREAIVVRPPHGVDRQL
jgi:chromosome segregation ATPase